MIKMELKDGRAFELEAGDQVTIGAVGGGYSGKWFCLSATTDANYVRRQFLSAPLDAKVDIGRTLKLVRGDIHSIAEVEV